MKKIVAFFLITLFAVFSGFIYSQTRLINEYAREQAELDAELEKENANLERLMREKEQYMSDAYVEKIAREKLGLVRQDEIVFFNDAAK